MKKYSFALLVVIVALMTSLVGCGSEETKTPSTNGTIVEFDREELAKDYLASNESNEDEEVIEEQRYTASDDIISAEIESGKFQLNDKVFQLGITIGELRDGLKDSNISIHGGNYDSINDEPLADDAIESDNIYVVDENMDLIMDVNWLNTEDEKLLYDRIIHSISTYYNFDEKEYEYLWIAKGYQPGVTKAIDMINGFEDSEYEQSTSIGYKYIFRRDDTELCFNIAKDGSTFVRFGYSIR